MIKLHQRADYNPCEHEPCPCGELFEDRIVRRATKYKDPIIVHEPIKDVHINTHAPRDLRICSTRTRAKIESMIDRRWIFTGSENCPNTCLGLKVKHRIYYFALSKIGHIHLELKRRAHHDLIKQSNP